MKTATMPATERRAILAALTERVLDQMQATGWWHWNGQAQEIRHDRPLPWDINNGLCQEWAEEAARLVGGYAFDISPRASHMVLRLGRRYFDAQCLDGVRTLRELPIVRQEPRP